MENLKCWIKEVSSWTLRKCSVPPNFLWTILCTASRGPGQRVAENDSEKFVCCQDDCALTQIVAIKTPFPMFLNKSKLLLIIFVHILYFKPTGFSEVSENELKLAQNIWNEVLSCKQLAPLGVWSGSCWLAYINGILVDLEFWVKVT